MDPSVYELFKILKFMLDQHYKGEKISQLTLADFCEKMLATSISSITYTAMYESCYRHKDKITDRHNFYQLSRDIDDKIMAMTHKDIRFKKYDNKIENIMKGKNPMYKMLSQQYSTLECNIFNLNNIEEPKPLKTKI